MTKTIRMVWFLAALAGPLLATNLSAQTRIIEKQVTRDPRLNTIAQRLGKFGIQRDRSFGLDGQLPADRDLVYPIVDKFLNDIGGYRVKSGYGFILVLRRAPIVRYDKLNPISRDMISAQIVDNSSSANGQILMSSKLEIECTRENYSYGCKLNTSIIEELLYKMSGQ